MIYLDNNATTRPAPEVVAAVSEALHNTWGNPSSQHVPGRAAARAVEVARNRLASLVGAPGDRIVFSSGATEANEGVLRHYLSAGYSLIVSETEHPALTGVCRLLAPNRIRTVPVDRTGQWDPVRLDEFLAASPALVAVAWSNGETGVLQDIAAIRDCSTRHGAPVLVDASQAVGRIPIDLGTLGVPYLTLSGHKFHAPKGIGALIQMDADANSVVLQVGGEQEGGRRGGTENVPGIVGLGVACDLRCRCLAEAIAHLARLRDRFEEMLTQRLPDIWINGAQAPRVPNTSNVTFPGVDGMALVARLENRGIICSQVSACSSGSPQPSSTLTAMGLTSEEAFASVRFAFAVDNAEPEVEIVVQALVDEVTALREMMGGLL